MNVPWSRGAILLVLSLVAGCNREHRFPASFADQEYEPMHPLTINRDATPKEDELVDLTNAYRASQGRTPLRRSRALDALALGHARHMLNHGFYAHDNPEGDGPYQRIFRAGASRWAVWENIWIVGPDDSTDFILAGFIASPHHNEILLADNTLVGVGLFRTQDALFVTMEFIHD